jgi:hypothetical protein
MPYLEATIKNKKFDTLINNAECCIFNGSIGWLAIEIGG